LPKNLIEHDLADHGMDHLPPSPGGDIRAAKRQEIRLRSEMVR
jgi:hypothetical protein